MTTEGRILEIMEIKGNGLVGLVAVSHSNKLAEEVINFAKLLQQEDFRIENGGNINQEVYGATVDTIKDAIRRADEGQGVLVFVDMGSSIFNAAKAVEDLQGKVKVEIADAPLVEGIISAVAANFDEMTLSELKEIAEGSRNFKKIKRMGMENLINIGTIIGTHHLLGSVKMNSIFTETELIIGERVLLEKDDKRKLLTIKNIKRLNDKKLIVDFEEIGNIDQAKELNGFQMKIRRDLLPEKNEDEFYIKDLLGVEVFSDNEKIGEITDVMETAAHDILIIEDIVNKKEIMVPLVDEFVKKIDFKNNRIEVELIEGMRE